MRPLSSTRDLFKKAYKQYAIGAFNVNDMEILQGIVEAAEEVKSPLILQFSAGARKYASHTYLVKLVEAALETSTIPIVMHLDHGEDFEIAKACIDGGFSSVMIDASKHPLEENIRITKQVVDYAHPRGVTVEAELGRLAGIEDLINVQERDATFTDPDEAVQFVEQTGCDSLAVAIGTSHGAFKFKGEPNLDIERLKKIQAKLPDFPLVLHGASSVPQELVDLCNQHGGKLGGAKGVPEKDIKDSIPNGVCKVNVDTDLRIAMTGAIRKVMHEKPEEFDPRKYLGPARDAIRAVVKHKLTDVFGCAGKA